MARKKKYDSENGNNSDKKNGKSKLDVPSEVKRSVLAIFLFALAVILVLGFFERAGILGEYLNKIAGLLFGWGKWILPLIFLIYGIILLFRKETLFYISKLLGLAVTFFSLLGFFHLFLEKSKVLEIARNGEGGGYLGYAFSLALVKLAGATGGAVILIALFLAGVVVAFNFSIFHLIQKALNIGKKEEKDFVGEEIKEENVEQAEQAEEKKDKDEEGNIKNIQFVEGPEENEEKKASPLDSAFKEDKKIKWPFGRKKKKEFAVRPLGQAWQFPPLDLLEESTGKGVGGDVEKNAQIIQKTLSNFGIEVELGDIQVGPTVTQYSFRPAVGVKLSKITALNNDLALALAAHPIRIEAPIPGRSLVGIEVPNKKAALVRLKNFLKSDTFQKRKSGINLALGEDVSGNLIFDDLDTMPHLMIAGATGTGKSICINSILISLLYQNSPQDLNLILIDPKRVELSPYNGVPHLLSKVIVENGQVVGALRYAVGEMEKRYRLLQDTGSRDIASYNQKVIAGQKRIYTDPETGGEKEEGLTKLPYIVIIIDELADLMAAHGREVEGVIIRLAQMARAVGIHLIVSTQRPSVEVLTGLIKANITTRIAFQVATQIDSRTILDIGGAEKLLGNGDMLYMAANTSKPKRIQGIFISEAEVKKVVKFIKSQKSDDYDQEEDITSIFPDREIDFSATALASEEDSLYEEAKRVIIEAKKASSSLLQRRLRVGYARAARLIDMLEERGVIGPADGAKPREVLTGNSGEPQYENPVEDQEVRDKWQM